MNEKIMFLIFLKVNEILKEMNGMFSFETSFLGKETTFTISFLNSFRLSFKILTLRNLPIVYYAKRQRGMENSIKTQGVSFYYKMKTAPVRARDPGNE